MMSDAIITNWEGCEGFNSGNVLVIDFGDKHYEIPLPPELTESEWEAIVHMQEDNESLTAENERLREVVEAAKAVDWRKVIRSQPRVIWWKYECWRNYGKFEAAIEELDNEKIKSE